MASFISEDNIEQALLQRLQYIHGFEGYRVSLRRRQLFHRLKKHRQHRSFALFSDR